MPIQFLQDKFIIGPSFQQSYIFRVQWRLPGTTHERPAALAWTVPIYMGTQSMYVEGAIYRCRPSTTSVVIYSPRALATPIEMRSGSFGVIKGLQEALSRNPEATRVPSFSGLVASLLATGKTR